MNLSSFRLPLGFTFSYPAIQERIDHGVLKTWTKGFDIGGMEGEDVAAQLKNAIAEKVGEAPGLSDSPLTRL